MFQRIRIRVNVCTRFKVGQLKLYDLAAFLVVISEAVQKCDRVPCNQDMLGRLSKYEETGELFFSPSLMTISINDNLFPLFLGCEE